jgi:hypothetical protein
MWIPKRYLRAFPEWLEVIILFSGECFYGNFYLIRSGEKNLYGQREFPDEAE